MLPWLILGVVAVLFLVVGAGAMSRNRRAEHSAGETDAERERTEHEFEEAERYQDAWRKEEREHRDDTLIP